MRNVLSLLILSLFFCFFSTTLMIGQSFDGFCLYNSLNSRNAFLLDSNGDIAHSWNCDVRGNYSVLLKDNGNIIRGGQYSRNILNGAAVGGMIQELDKEANVVWEFIYSDATHVQHHDLSLLPNGNVLITAWEVKDIDELQSKGYNRGTTSKYPTQILEIAQDGVGGKIVWQWNMWDHLIQDVDTTLDNFGIIADNPQLMDINVTITSRGFGGDWFHVNGLDYDPVMDQIVFSSRFLSEIFVIDHSTTTEEAAGHTGGNSGMGGDLLYRWGNPSNYDTNGERHIPAAVHDARIIDNNGGPNHGFLQFFNNSGGMFGGSAVMALDLPRDGFNFIKEEGQAYGPDEPTWVHYTRDAADGQSASDRLPNGNTFVCLSNTYLYEVDAQENLVWQSAARTAKAFRYTCVHPGIITLLDNPCEISTSTYNAPQSELTLIPNPSQSYVRLEGNEYHLNTREVNIYNIHGKLVSKFFNTDMIDVSDLDAGTYVLQASFSNGPPAIEKLQVVR